MMLIRLSIVVASALLAASVWTTAAAGEPQVVELAVTARGFEPRTATVKKDEPVKLVVTRKTDDTCATEIVIKAYDVRATLPLNVPVTVAFVPTRSGPVTYACAMGMVTGTLVVE
ncbi:MAG: cupredoxin domain-containing protein [Candidatus Binatia bacterium]